MKKKQNQRCLGVITLLFLCVVAVGMSFVVQFNRSILVSDSIVTYSRNQFANIVIPQDSEISMNLVDDDFTDIRGVASLDGAELLESDDLLTDKMQDISEAFGFEPFNLGGGRFVMAFGMQLNYWPNFPLSPTIGDTCATILSRPGMATFRCEPNSDGEPILTGPYFPATHPTNPNQPVGTRSCSDLLTLNATFITNGHSVSPTTGVPNGWQCRDLASGAMEFRPFEMSRLSLPDAPPLVAGVNRCPQEGAVATYGNPVVTADYSIWADSTGFQWCVIVEDGNYSMLVARHTIQMMDSRWNGGFNNNRLHNINEHVLWPVDTSLAGGPEGRNRLHAWWNHDSQVSDTLRLHAVDAIIPRSDDTADNSWVLDSSNGGTENTRANNDAHFSSPINGSAPITGSAGRRPVFFLSEVEVYQWLGQTNPAARITNRVDHATFGNTTIATTYWLRSIGTNAGQATVVNTLGYWDAFFTSNTFTSLSFRPAVWIAHTADPTILPISFPQPLAAGQNQCEQTGSPTNIWVDPITGFEWCAVMEKGDYLLLVARHTIQNDRIDNDVTTANRNHSTNMFEQWPANTSLAGGPEARGRMLTWWERNDQVSDVLRDAAVDANIPTRFVTIGISQAERGADILTTSLSSPLVGSSSPTNPIFFLNEAEVNVFLGQDDAQTSRVTYRIYADGTVGEASWYWLRSAGAGATSSIVNHSGNWDSTSANITNTAPAFRPALWIRR